MKHDPRVTRIGRFIRRFSIDELPQVWCVLKGDMSIVGPRPPVPREVALNTQEDRRRLEVTPGLTGIWQVSGRAEIGLKQQVELDVLLSRAMDSGWTSSCILKNHPRRADGKGEPTRWTGNSGTAPLEDAGIFNLLDIPIRNVS